MTYINEEKVYHHTLNTPLYGGSQDQNKNSILVLSGSSSGAGDRLYLSKNYKKGDTLRAVYVGPSNVSLDIRIPSGCTINSSYGNVSNSSGTDYNTSLNVTRYSMIALVCISASFDGSGNYTQSIWRQMFV